jgi:hypothetical protein
MWLERGKQQGDVLILFKSCLSGCSMWRRFAQRMASCQSSFSIFAVFANKKATVYFFKSRMSSVTIFLLFYVMFFLSVGGFHRIWTGITFFSGSGRESLVGRASYH